MIKATNTKNPVMQADFRYFSQKAKHNWGEAEAYRKRVTNEGKLPVPESTHWAWETKKEDIAEQLSKSFEKKEQSLDSEKKGIKIEALREQLKGRGIKGLHLIKDEQKLLSKAMEFGIL